MERDDSTCSRTGATEWPATPDFLMDRQWDFECSPDNIGDDVLNYLTAWCAWRAMQLHVQRGSLRWAAEDDLAGNEFLKCFPDVPEVVVWARCHVFELEFV